MSNSEQDFLDILLVEDEIDFIKKIQKLFRNKANIESAGTIREARAVLKEKTFDIVLLDYKLPDGYATTLLEDLCREADRNPVIFLSANNSPDLINECIALGADDFIVKDSKFDTELVTRIPLAIKRVKNQEKQKELERLYRSSFRFELVGDSQAMKKIRSKIATLVGENIKTVLITGPSGSGKDQVARNLNLSEGKHRPFIAVNCSAINHSSFEGSFYGCERSDFSGVEKRRIGFLELAEGGDLYLDEICELSMSHQRKLLRFLIDKEYLPLGGSVIVRSDCRIIASSSKSLQVLVKSGQFLKELYYRLNTHSLNLPALEDRREDIQALAGYFLLMLAGPNFSFSSELSTYLQNTDWPNNVLELRHVVEDGYLNAKERDGREIAITDLSRKGALSEMQTFLPKDKKDVTKRHYQKFVERSESLYWMAALKLFDGNASRLSKHSEFPLSTINLKIKEYNLRRMLDE